ncbi:MAG TPA: GIY-YIG nuclease family protein [Bacteroidia bacterium]|nr:GIY-YIG nuclease family protein [Bacteroidia bacterium]
MKLFFAYILRSRKDGRYYYGSTGNLDRRIAEHNSGRVRSAKHRGPFELHYCEMFGSRSEAYRREIFFKTIDGYLWLRENKIILETCPSG